MEPGFEFITQHLIMERHLNSAGNLFGGTVLSWLDEAGAMFVMERIRYQNIVTISMDDVYFRNPGQLSDNIKIFGKITQIKSSSIEIQTRAYAVNPVDGISRQIISCKIVFVCLNEDKKPYPYFRKAPAGIELKQSMNRG